MDEGNISDSNCSVCDGGKGCKTVTKRRNAHVLCQIPANVKIIPPLDTLGLYMLCYPVVVDQVNTEVDIVHSFIT